MLEKLAALILATETVMNCALELEIKNTFHS